MIGSIQLSLMIGPAVPLPAPRVVVDALVSAKVTASAAGDSGFELVFKLDKNSPLQTLFLLSGGAGIPFLRVVLVVTMGGTPEVLIDGMVTHHQVQPGEGGQATLSVQGKDLSVAMTYFDFSGLPYPCMPPVARAALIIAKYAWLGMIPVTIPSLFEDIPIPTDRIPRHQGTDLDYLKSLADDCGYVFYVSPGPAPGTTKAYWGPDVRVGAPQPALNIDMDAHTNVESVSFRFDKEQKEMPIVFIQTKTPVPITIPIPIPDVTPLNPPLGLIPPLPPKLKPLDTGNLGPVQAIMKGVAYAAQHSDAVFADGSLDVLRYGRILREGKLVGMRGAGTAYDGLYYVKSVTHNIKRGEYKQSFSLARNGLVSTVPKVAA